MQTVLYHLIESRPGHVNFGLPFYVGIGGKRRPLQHLRSAKRGRAVNELLLATLLAHIEAGVEPGSEVVAIYATRAEAADAERVAIALFGRQGRDVDGILCNVARGGQGPDPELLADPLVKAKLSAASLKYWAKPESRSVQRAASVAYWADHPEARRAQAEKIAAYYTAEQRQAHGELVRTALNGPDVRARHIAALEIVNANLTAEMRAAAADRKSDDAKLRSTQALLSILNDPVIQQRRRENSRAPQKASWTDPAIRAKRTEGMKGKKKTMSPEAIEARRQNAKKSNSAEQRALNAELSRQRWADPEFRARMAEKRRQAWEDPEKRAAMLAGRGEGIAKSWQDPATRARRVQAIKKAGAKRAGGGEGEEHQD